MDRSFVTRTEWLATRRQLMLAEKALTEALDAVAQRRRMLPWVKVEKDYVFEGPGGQRTLEELFEGKRQLVVYHFMFGPDWEEGCPSCSFVADNFNGMDVHLAQRDTAFVAISNTSLENINAYKQRMGWQFKWLSSEGTEFNYDYDVSFSEAALEAGEAQYNFEKAEGRGTERPGMSVFIRTEDGGIAHSYSCYARGLDIMLGGYQILDFTPLGRNEGDLPFPMAWIRRHDSYGEDNA